LPRILFIMTCSNRGLPPVTVITTTSAPHGLTDHNLVSSGDAVPLTATTTQAAGAFAICPVTISPTTPATLLGTLAPSHHNAPVAGIFGYMLNGFTWRTDRRPSPNHDCFQLRFAAIIFGFAEHLVGHTLLLWRTSVGCKNDYLCTYAAAQLYRFSFGDGRWNCCDFPAMQYGQQVALRAAVTYSSSPVPRYRTGAAYYSYSYIPAITVQRARHFVGLPSSSHPFCNYISLYYCASS